MAKQSKTEELFVIMEPGFESVCGFDPANVVMYRPYYAKGTKAKAYKCYKTQGPVGSNREYWNGVRREMQQEARESRCMVRSPKTGRLIRCESNCDQCPGFLNGDIIKEKNRPASTEYIVEKNLEAHRGEFGDSCGKRSIDSPLVTGMEDEVLDRIMLDVLIEKAATLSPKHGEIFKLLFDGNTQQAIADKLGMKQRTVSDKIKAIRALLAPDVRQAE